MIVNYLANHRGITQAEAISALGCYRLSARIAELKERGYLVERVWEDGVNRFGAKTRYARYFIRKVAA